MCKYLVGILLNASTSTDENDAIDVEMQCDMLFTVASLCEGDTHRKVKLWAEEFVNHSPAARDLQILLVFYQHPAWFISLNKP